MRGPWSPFSVTGTAAGLAFLGLAALVASAPSPSGLDRSAVSIAATYGPEVTGAAPRGTLWGVAGILGEWLVLLVVGGVGAVALAVRGERARAAWVLGSALAASVVVYAFKLAVGRPRPFDPSDATAFPSGHSANVFILFLLLWAIEWSRARPSPLWRGALPALTAGAAVSTGLARVMSLNHWPTDVLGGWLLGLAYGGWAAHWIIAAPAVGPARKRI